jgi:putative transposase
VVSYLEDGDCVRESKWTQSVAIGTKRFVDNTKQALGIRAKGRKVLEAGEAYQLRELQISYPANFWLRKRRYWG